MYSCSHVLCTHARGCNSHYLRQCVQCGLGRETVPGVEVQGGASDGGVHSEPPLLQDVVQGAEHGDLPANVKLVNVNLIMIMSLLSSSAASGVRTPVQEGPQPVLQHVGQGGTHLATQRSDRDCHSGL